MSRDIQPLKKYHYDGNEELTLDSFIVHLIKVENVEFIEEYYTKLWVPLKESYLDAYAQYHKKENG